MKKKVLVGVFVGALIGAAVVSAVMLHQVASVFMAGPALLALLAAAFEEGMEPDQLGGESM